MTARPRIGFFSQVAPFPPPLFGAQIRVERLVRELLVEFDVAFVCQTSVDEETLTREWSLGRDLSRVVTVPRPPTDPSKDPQWGPHLRSATAALRYFVPGSRPALHDYFDSRELVSTARAVLEEQNIDVVWASRSWMAEMARAAGARSIIVDIDDFDGRTIAEQLSRSESYRRKPLHRMQAAHLQRYERHTTRRFEGVCVCKEEDRSLLDPGGGARTYVVPNGVDLPTSASESSRVPLAILFVGALWYEPNAEALRQFINDVLPTLRQQLPGTTLAVAGRGPIAPELSEYLSRPGVEVHESPSDLGHLYARASLCVAPLRTGGGTSIKVLESLAHRVPIVATPVAVRGLGLKAGTHLAVAGSAEELIHTCVDLLTNRDKARAMACAGYEEVSRCFTWPAVGQIARIAVRELLAGHRDALSGTK